MMIMTMVIPPVVRYQNELLTNFKNLTELGIGSKKTLKAQKELIEELTDLLSEIKQETDKMNDVREKANEHQHAREMALVYCHQVKPCFDRIRNLADRLEQLTDDRAWVLPKYRELLFQCKSILNGE